MCRKLYVALALAAVLGLGSLSSAEAQYRPRNYHSRQQYCPPPPCPPYPPHCVEPEPFPGQPHYPYGRYQRSDYGRYRQSDYRGNGNWRSGRR